MAFPTSAVLDTFNRANESPATGWTDGPDGGTYGNIQVVSNQGASVTTDAWSYWSASTPGPDCEVYGTYAAISAALELYCRMGPIGAASVDGYVVVSDATNIRMMRMDNSVNTILGANIAQALSAGDSFGMDIIGSTLNAYYKASAGSWGTSIGNRSDATYSSAGRLGVYMPNTTQRLDDFGGGDYVSSVPGTDADEKLHIITSPLRW